MIEDRDGRLVALLDGALPEAEAATLRAEIAADPALQARLNALDVDLSDLGAEADLAMSDAPPMPTTGAARGSLVGLAIAASLALALVLGGVLIGARSDGSEDWRDFAAAYHLLYRPDTLAAPMQGDGGVAMVSEALGRDLSELAELEGLDFRRAQILGWQGETLIQFAYLDASGQPVAVCVMEIDEEPVGVTLASEGRHGLATTTIAGTDLQVLVIGPNAEADTEGLARRIATELSFYTQS